jgi:hypothetical protein
MLPVPIPPPEPNVHIQGYVNEKGEVVLEHMGGETLSSYEIYITQSCGIKLYKSEEPWEIGGKCFPPINASLFAKEKEVKITVFSVHNDGNKQVVFEGIFLHEEEPDKHPKMLVSTLRKNTSDEDLICYTSPPYPTTYIFNWLVNRGEGYSPITDLLMPFDTQSSSVSRDYSKGNNGIIKGAAWISSGKVGGAYYFNGSSYISIPYIFESEYIDEITVETWIKTSNSSGTIVSFERYWELAVSSGYAKWSTNASDGTFDIISTNKINDGEWHHVVATYDSTSGEGSIYIDGKLDTCKQAHDPGELLGSGESPQGYIGKGVGKASRETIFYSSFESTDEKDLWKEHNKTEGEITWETLWYDDFEGGEWGNWNDGGKDCQMYSGGTYAYQGECAINIQDNSGSASSTYSNVIDASDYVEISIDLHWIAKSMEPGEDFWINYYDGENTYRLKTIVIGTGEYENYVFYHTICYVNDTSESAQFIIQCDASSNYDDVYLDEIYVNVSKEKRLDYDFDLRSSDELLPRSGAYSLGGSGDFDPESVAFNRTSIDISNYTNISVSVWYSYKSTESVDEFAFYYKKGNSWTPIFEEPSPEIGDGNQLNWTLAEVDIPDGKDLVFQFLWSTSSSSEYVAIDDLEVTGIPKRGEDNFTGVIDELKIYDRVLSPEQIYQNYLCSGLFLSVIVSEETLVDESWKCVVTPNNGEDGDPIESNVLKVVCGGV